MNCLPFDFAERCTDHYFAANIKHPYFADNLESVHPAERAGMCTDAHLELEDLIRKSKVNAEAVLVQQLDEMFLAIGRGFTDRAIYKAYDAIAVLMRIICVLEGTQKLGKVGGEGAAETGKEVR